MDATKVAVAMVKPGWRRRPKALLGYSSRSWPCAFLSRARSATSAKAALAEADGGVSGRSRNSASEATAAAMEQQASTSK